ncbi:hypothetical protein AKJ52_02460 [candidate division MSBL1 archaeon SCGC-AAA382C18]|uniref:Uncharacterized protein n=1 Tax=candidate division MSBL1 archaeon SCGC-AAA382C18 TaxID=1698281 RepID=A0A133VIC4_9EURY|nr:hypothetical protein AKJ52_02460 [candidate division MSBL1 archaeon SCGC-AAA382C18]
MKREQLRKNLSKKLKNLPWGYTLGTEEETIQFSNVKTESLDEKEFLKSLDEEGSEQIIEGTGELTYKFARVDGKLQLSLSLDEDKVVKDGEEVEEKEALRIFRESKKGKESRGLGDLFNFFKRGSDEPPKEFVPNEISVECDRIANIALKDNDGFKSLEITGEGFKLELRGDGGCSILFL